MLRYISPALAYNVTQHGNIDNNLNNYLSPSLYYGRADGARWTGERTSEWKHGRISEKERTDAA